MKILISLVLALAVLSPGEAETQPASSQATVEITFRKVVDARLPPAWDVLLQPSAASLEPPSRRPVHAGEPLRLQLAPGTSWEVSTDLPGFWVPRKSLTVGRAGEVARLELDLWPLGKISGRLQAKEKGGALPREVLVKTVAAPAALKRPPMPPGVLSCPVDKEGGWSCSLPAATFDLVIAAEGFTPHYRWGIAVPPAKAVELGTFPIERGGSLAGWVVAEGGAIDPAQAMARLTLLAACDTDASSVLQLSRTSVERPVGKDGFLQMTGLAGGSYALEVRQPGFAPVRLADVHIVPLAETFLPEPLVLTRPIALEFEIAPPLDERGGAWRARVTRRSDDASPAPAAFDGPADTEGRFTVADQSPGRFQVVISDSRGNRIHSEPELQLDGSARHKIELHRIAVTGRLRLGSEPLAGTLWFGGRHGEKSVKMTADEKGRFAGVLPEQDFWAVDVEAAEPKLAVRTRAEARSDRSGRATISIDLPDTRIFGRVVDQNGRPAARAFIVVTSEGLDQHVEVDGAGAFDLRGVSEGLSSLIATNGEAGQSERAVVTASRGSKVGPIELRLRPVRSLAGAVTSALGPVAGARVVVLAHAPSVGGGQAMTGPEGTFTLELPADLRSVTAVVKAPGFGTQAFPLTLGEKAIALTLSESAGVLSIALPRSAGALQRDNLRVALFQNGLEVPLNLLREDVTTSADKEGALLRLANLAPGRYQVCIAQKEIAAKGSVSLDPQAAVSCESGDLASGGTLDLALREKG